MSNIFNVKMHEFTVKDHSKGIATINGTVEVGNTYQDYMGFGELWVITKIECDEIYLVCISNQFRPTVVTSYDESFLLKFARYLVGKSV